MGAFRAPKPQSEYDKALDLLKWKRLGVAPGQQEELPTMLRCRAIAGHGHQCALLACRPMDHPIYCTIHFRKFLGMVSGTSPQETK